MFSALTRPRTSLDRAIIASIAAMLAMNVVVLAEQLHAAPRVALTATTAVQA